MTLKLYHTSDPKNKVKKKLEGEHTYNNVIFHREDCLDILRPEIQLNGVTEITDLTKYNYFYLAKFTRYYFISDIIGRGSSVVIKGEVDPLMSWKSNILSSKQYISRQEHAPDLYSLSKYYVDDLLPISSQKEYAVKQFGNAVDDRGCYHVILETVGKGDTPV